MKKIVLTIFAAILLIMNGFTQNVSVTCGTVNGVSGQIANVPVNVSGIDENAGGTAIIGFQVEITYQTSIVTFLDINSTTLNATLSANGTWNTSAIDNGLIHVDWQANDITTPVNVTDGEMLFECRFIANNGGTSPLNMINVEFTDVNGTNLPTTLTNGSITFAAPATTSTWNGTGTWYTAANWSNGLPGKATQTIIASGVITVDAACYSANMTINPGAGVTINTSKTLAVNGNLVLASSASSAATGSLLRNGNLTVSGTITVQRYLTGATQHFISVPVTAASISNLIDPSNPGYFFKFNETTNSWENPWDPAYQLSLATGYSVNYTNGETIALNGALNNDASYSPTLTRAGQRFNLVGNPYSCPIDWTIASGWTKTSLDDAIYIWNTNVYAYFVNGVGTNGGTKYIPQFQGFFVRAQAGGSAPAISIKKAARTQSGNSSPYLKDEVANVLKMTVSNGTLSDQTAVYMFDGATEEFDGNYDAYKLIGFIPEAPHVFTRSNEVDYAINGLPVSETVSVPMVFKTGAAGEYSILSEGFESFNGFYFFILEDKETGVNYDLQKNPSLVLNLPEGESAGRFMLRIFKSGLGIGDEELSNLRVYSESKKIYIENCPEADIFVYNLTGEVVASKKVAESSLNILDADVATGIYVVKVMTQGSAISSKVFVK